MSGFLILAGYVVLIAVAGWPGVAAAGLHVLIMLMAVPSSLRKPPPTAEGEGSRPKPPQREP